MKKSSPEHHSRDESESVNPLLVINVAMAIFFVGATIILALT